eukprot:6194829-Pleurochrysis_carterae.AAC.1
MSGAGLWLKIRPADCSCGATDCSCGAGRLCCAWTACVLQCSSGRIHVVLAMLVREGLAGRILSGARLRAIIL